MNWHKIAMTLVRWWRKFVVWLVHTMTCLLLCPLAAAADPIVVTTDGPATVTVTPADPVVTVENLPAPVPDYSRPLPVFSSWNMGKGQTAPGQDAGYTPEWQQQQMLAGVPLLPTFEHSFWLDNTHRNQKPWHFGERWNYVRDNRLPIGFVGWNFLDRLRLGQWPGATPLPADHPFVIKADGVVVKTCSPWSPNWWHWRDEGWRIGKHLAKTYATDYPDPPAIYLFDNNEAGIATLEESQLDRRTPAFIVNARNRLPIEQARAVERIEYTRAIQQRFAIFRQALRDALPPGWKKIKFVAYETFGNEFGMAEFTPDSLAYSQPWSAIGLGHIPTHDGVAANVGYLHDWYQGNVGLVRSPSMEAGNVRFAIDTMREINPAYEVMSLYWNGKNVTPEQYLGMCRCVLWQTQTPIHMAWVGASDTRAATYAKHIQPLMQAVQEVHDNPMLSRFWRDGKLLRNRWTRDFNTWPKVNPAWDNETGYGHPYSWMMPPEFSDTGSRYFLQHVPSNKRHVKWREVGGSDDRFVDQWESDREHKLAVKVFAICLQLGDEYLVYAHAPGGAQGFVRIEVCPDGNAPRFKTVVDVPVEGAFYTGKAGENFEKVAL